MAVKHNDMSNEDQSAYMKRHGGGKVYGLPYPTKELKDLQTKLQEAEARAEWIPVSERKPEGECLCIGYQSEILIGYLSKTIGVDEFTCENENTLLEHVTHWQPLPEPPKEV